MGIYFLISYKRIFISRLEPSNYWDIISTKMQRVAEGKIADFSINKKMKLMKILKVEAAE